jgi:DNA-binding transcriptional ArsR family regulator
VLGRTRARLLTELVQPANTGALARRLKLAAGTVSEHLRALQSAGLIASRRNGRLVEYRITDLGRSLLDTSR